MIKSLIYESGSNFTFYYLIIVLADCNILIHMELQGTGGDLKSKFLHAIANDTPITRLWKYRIFLQANPNAALALKDRMLEYALKNKLVGQFEMIQSLLGVQLNEISREGVYGALKTEMQTTVNRLKIEASQLEQVGSLQQQLRIYLKLGQIYAQLGDHKESQYYYSRILRKQSGSCFIKDQAYLGPWGRQIFYLVDSLEERPQLQLKNYQDLQFFSVRVFSDRKAISSTLAFVRDIYKLTRKGRTRNKVKVLQNLIQGSYSTQELLGARILGLADLGLLYSLLALAYKSREALKKDIKWSSKLEISYLNADYRKLLQDLNRSYENYGQFSLPIKLMYEQCLVEIKRKVLNEIFTAYQSIPVNKVEKMTGLRAFEIQSWVKQHSDEPYLWDPITQSVVYYEKSVPLYSQAMTFYRLVKEKYEEKERLLSNEGRQQVQIDAIISRINRESGIRRMHHF